MSHGFKQHTHALEFDHIVFALGCVTNFYGIPNLAETAMTMKSLGDAMALRNRLIAHLEEADTECATIDRESLLTFVVAGSGFAGVETIGSINDFLNGALPYYPTLKPEMIRVVLVHPGEFVLPELGEELGRYTPFQGSVPRQLSRWIDICLKERSETLTRPIRFTRNHLIFPTKRIIRYGNNNTNN